MDDAGLLLLVRDGHPECRLVPLTENVPVVVGRASSCDVVVADKYLSPRHCEITRLPNDEWRVRDLASHNGTFVTSERVTDFRGEAYVLRAGNSLLFLEPDSSRFRHGPVVVDRGRVLGPLTRAAFERMRSFAANDEPVLIVGEKGIGKYHTFVERYCEISPRRSFPIVEMRWCLDDEATALRELCGLAPHQDPWWPDGVESRLLAARGGVLCLDAIETATPEVQARLVRLLTRGEVVPLGAYQPLGVDVQVIATAETDLAARVDAGAFRRDLYDLMTRNVVQVPPLRHREEEIPFIAALSLRNAMRRSLEPVLPMTASGFEELIVEPPSTVLGVQAVAWRAEGGARSRRSAVVHAADVRAAKAPLRP